MNHLILKTVINDMHEVIKEADIVDREYVFEKNVNYVLIGIRRAGKSTLLYKIVRDLIAEGVDWNRIIYVNFEDERLTEFSLEDFNDLVATAGELTSEKPYFFLDEVQNIPGWERFARRMADAREHVYITGSNAAMLSHEMESRLGGRYMTMHVYPYNFREYLTASKLDYSESAYLTTKLNGRLRSAAQSYLTDGGFPESLMFVNRRSYVENIYQKILYGDILARNAIRNPESLRLMMKKIAETVTSELSISKLSGTIQATGVKLSKDTAAEYVNYAENAYLVFRITNFVAKFAERDSVPKYYFSDNGLLNLFLINKNSYLLENIVGIKLHQQFSDRLFYFKSPKTGIDIDFYTPDNHTAIQVAFSIEEEAARKREVDNLVKLSRSFEDAKRFIIVTLEEEETIEIAQTTIEVIPLYKYLAMRDC